MDRESINRDQVIARYVADRLSPQERATFEAWCIAHPEIAPELDLERSLQTGFRAAAHQGWLDTARRQQSRIPVMIAASVAAIALAGAFWLLHANRTQGVALATAHTVDTTHTTTPGASYVVAFARLRGEADRPDQELNLATLPAHVIFEPEAVVLRCADGTLDFECHDGSAPSTPQYPLYRLELLRSDTGAVAWRSADQPPGEGARLSFVAHASTLVAGDYDVVVRGLSASNSEAVARYRLRVTARD